MSFLKEFIFSPTQTGAVASSSKFLAKTMIESSELKDAKCIVELGSGTGVFTKEILGGVSEGVVFFGLEVNPVFVETTKDRCPEAVIYQASAKDLSVYLKKYDRSNCDRVISGLPWAAFERENQEELLGAIFKSLAPGGLFVTFTYVHSPHLPAGKQFKRRLMNLFLDVQTSPVVWRNIPPAFVYICRK